MTGLMVALFAFMPAMTNAQSPVTSFNQDLQFGQTNSSVTSLQSFLYGLGYLTVKPTGYFGAQTKTAVERYQAANKISATGYFGPMTRAAVNKTIAGALTKATLTISNPISGNVEVGQTQTVTWTSNNYSSPTVSVNLIRKVSDNPARYKLVRTISASTKNDGSATWVPAPTDVGAGLSIEIGCTSSAKPCQAADTLNTNLAVVPSTRFANTANAYSAIEQLNNK